MIQWGQLRPNTWFKAAEPPGAAVSEVPYGSASCMPLYLVGPAECHQRSRSENEWESVAGRRLRSSELEACLLLRGGILGSVRLCWGRPSRIGFGQNTGKFVRQANTVSSSRGEVLLTF